MAGLCIQSLTVNDGQSNAGAKWTNCPVVPQIICQWQIIEHTAFRNWLMIHSFLVKLTFSQYYSYCYHSWSCGIEFPNSRNCNPSQVTCPQSRIPGLGPTNSVPELELQLNSNSDSWAGIGIEIGGIENEIGVMLSKPPDLQVYFWEPACKAGRRGTNPHPTGTHSFMHLLLNAC